MTVCQWITYANMAILQNITMTTSYSDWGGDLSLTNELMRHANE